MNKSLQNSAALVKQERVARAKADYRAKHGGPDAPEFDQKLIPILIDGGKTPGEKIQSIKALLDEQEGAFDTALSAQNLATEDMPEVSLTEAVEHVEHLSDLLDVPFHDVVLAIQELRNAGLL